MNGSDEQSPGSTSRGAVVISQAYYYVVAAIGLAFLLGGLIAALIALRTWVFPIAEAGSPAYIGGSVDGRDPARSFLGALAFAIPGALVLAWHLREARRREGARASSDAWGSVLYFHLVALIALVIGLGGLVATLHAVRDRALPSCYDPSFAALSPVEGAVAGSGVIGEVSPSIDPQFPGDLNIGPTKPLCYPPSSEAIRNVVDGGIVASVAGGTWLWHLRRGRRAFDGRSSEG